MRKEYAFLREVQIQADAVDPRDLLKAILIKSAEHYVKGAPFFQPYTYSESFYINSSKQFSLFVPKAYFNAFDDKKPFVKCYFYPVDSLIVNTSEIVNMKLVRGPLGFYSFRRFLPVPEIPDELTAKDNEYLIYGVNNEEARLEIDNIKKRGLENKAEIVYKGKDSLVTMYFTEVTSSSGFADMRMSAGVSMIYDGYTYKPPFSRYFKAIYLEEDESYLLREIQYVIEVAFVRKESDEVKVMTNEISIKVLQEKALLEEKLKDSGAKRLMGAIDGFTKHEYYNNYIRKTSVKER